MWVSSWPSTASSSASSSVSISPDVTVIEYCFWLRPVANALSEPDSITLSLGMVMPREMHRFSSRFHSRGCSWRVTSTPPVIASIID